MAGVAPERKGTLAREQRQRLPGECARSRPPVLVEQVVLVGGRDREPTSDGERDQSCEEVDGARPYPHRARAELVGEDAAAPIATPSKA